MESKKFTNIKSKSTSRHKRQQKRQNYKVKTKEGKAIEANLNEIVNKEILEQRAIPREKMNLFFSKLLPMSDKKERTKSMKVNQFEYYRLGSTIIDLTKIDFSPKTFWTLAENEAVDKMVNNSNIDKNKVADENQCVKMNNDQILMANRNKKLIELHQLVDAIVRATKLIESNQTKRFDGEEIEDESNNDSSNISSSSSSSSNT